MFQNRENYFKTCIIQKLVVYQLVFQFLSRAVHHDTFTIFMLSVLLYSVCVTAGHLLSYFNRPIFPEWCSHGSWDEDTMVRMAGSYLGFAQTLKAVADQYGWTHIVLLSNDDASKSCWYGAKAVDTIFAKDDNYTYAWLRLGSEPTDKQLDDVLWQIRSRTRGIAITVFTHSYIFVVFLRCCCCCCCCDKLTIPSGSASMARQVPGRDL